MKTINCIGCGKLGKTILKLIVDKQLAYVNDIVNQSLHSARESVKFIGQGNALSKLDEITPADIYFIATRDDAIQTVCEELIRKNLLKPGSFILHFSGSLSSDILSSARMAHCYIASAHPVKSFSEPSIVVNTFLGTYIALEGDQEAVTSIGDLLKGIGGTIFNIKKENKRQYHAAMVIANNYLTTLHFQAMKNLKNSGVDEKIAKNLVSMLMNDSLNNVNRLNHKDALTGPIQRGDTMTIKGHMEALKTDPTSIAIYTALGKGTLSLTSHDPSKKKELEDLLSGDQDMKHTSAISNIRSHL